MGMVGEFRRSDLVAVGAVETDAKFFRRRPRGSDPERRHDEQDCNHAKRSVRPPPAEQGKGDSGSAGLRRVDHTRWVEATAPSREQGKAGSDFPD